MTADTIHQKILSNFSNYPANIPLRRFSRRHAGMAVKGLVPWLGEKTLFVGIAVQHDPRGRVELLALATVTEVVVIAVEDKPSELLTHDKPFEDLLCGNSHILVGFDMGRLVIRIANDLKLSVRGIDLSTAFRANTWGPPLPSDVVKTRLFQDVNSSLVDGMWINEQGPREMGLRAWLAACVAEANEFALQSVVRLDTSNLTSQEVLFLAELVRQVHVLDAGRPKETPAEFTTSTFNTDGLALQNARYKTRVRRGGQMIIMTNDRGQEFIGEARGCKGRTTNIRFNGQAFSGKLDKVRVVGRPPLTNTEKARNELVLRVLQGLEFLRSPFIQMLWFPAKRRQDNRESLPATHFANLNPSQEAVASRMVSDCRLVIAHGPPGTGKTTTIAAAVSMWEQQRLPTWIIAHSNVAVKNMAETLFKKGVDFKILVSKEFHFEWHEHIYEEINERVLISDIFLGVKDRFELSRILGDTCIMLSTLGMLSNPTLDRIGIFTVVPVGRLVVDEASQIKIEDFLHILHRFQGSLKKLCFFGDPNQLPPYGKDQVPEIRTIFDLPHLKETAGFLDTQYRMPAPLGNFISKYVYNGRLKSEHAIHNMSCVSFVDVTNGSETKSGFSWTNLGETQALVNIVKTYYRHRKFCIITPYDAQRAAIERQLKAENLPWQHVFNVDSFQGNETDLVLVSVVRSGTSPGFLSSKNRMNVLLTRCKRGLVVVTSRSFMIGGGRDTLLGYLERRWMEIQGNSTWVDRIAISEGTADLPDALGPNRARRGVLFEHNIGSTTAAGHAPARTFDVRSLFPRQPVSRHFPEVLPPLSPSVPRKPLDSLFSAGRSPVTPSYEFSTSGASASSGWNRWSPPPVKHLATHFKTPSSEYAYDVEYPKLPTIRGTMSTHKQSQHRESVDRSKDAKRHAQKAPPMGGAGSRRLDISDQQRYTQEVLHIDGRVRRLQISDQQIARAHPERLFSNTEWSEKQKATFSSRQRKADQPIAGAHHERLSSNTEWSEKEKAMFSSRQRKAEQQIARAHPERLSSNTEWSEKQKATFSSMGWKVR